MTIILIAAIVIFNISYNLNNALHFDESDGFSITVIIMKNVNGRAVSESESFTFEKETIEFAAINNLFHEYSYKKTTARNIDSTIHRSNLTTITILGKNNSSLFLTTTSSSNIIVNGMFRRIGKKRVQN